MTSLLKLLSNWDLPYWVFLIGSVLYFIPGINELMKYFSNVILCTFSILSFKLSYEIRRKDIVLITLLIIFAFIIEAVGVKTGLVFGDYRYLDGLWPQVLGVPLVIGLMWVNLTFGSYYILSRFGLRDLGLLIVSPLLVTLFDYIMEPSAIFLRYWEWDYGVIPVQNYIAWYLISFIMTASIIVFRVKIRSNNFIKHVFLSQVIFFVIIRFLSKSLV